MNDDAFDALNSLDPGMPRETWVRIAFAAKDAGITEDEFIAWSSGAPNFDRADAISTFRNAKPRAGGVTSATLYMMARDAGYRPEDKPRDRTPAKGGNGGNGAARVATPSNDAHHGHEVERAAPDVAAVWAACREVAIHGYLSRKSIKAHGCRVNSTGGLVVPYHNASRELQTVQTISVDGTKRFLAGARQRGSVVILGEPKDAEVVIVCEGFATAAAIEEATGFPTLAAGSRVSLPEGARIARAFAPRARLVIAADRGDLSTPLAAARASGAFLACPGPEDSADGFDFADWRLNGATDAEIRARIEHAPPVPRGDDQPSATIHSNSSQDRPARNTPTAAHQVTTAGPRTGEVGPYLVDGKGRIVANLYNACAFLHSNAVGDLKRDTFTGVVTWKGAPMQEGTYLDIQQALQCAVIDGSRPFVKIPAALVIDAIANVSESNSFNSNVQWLDRLEPWDGTPRIERFFADVCELDATDYLLGVGRFFWLGLVGRMVRPGLQVDSAVALIGAQGIGKSSLARIIGGDRYGEVGLHDIGSRDWCVQLRGKVVVEIGELSGHSRAELESIKAVLTRTTDEYRAAYARTSSHIPRGCVFIATTNEDDFLIDAGGNRRWLPVRCAGPLLLETLRNTRDQLFAEAYHATRAGLSPSWWVVPDAAVVQARHLVRDPWIDLLDESLRDNAGALPHQVANVALYSSLKLTADKQTGATGRRLRAVMSTLGYVRASWYTDDGSRRLRGYQLEQTDPA